MSWRRTLIGFIFWALLASAWSLYFDNHWGWMTLALSTGALLTWRRYQATKVTQWAKSLNQSPPPQDIGPWQDLVDELHRFTKIQANLIASSKETAEAVMLAAQALPVGVVALDRDFKIAWLNHAAQQHLCLDPTRDVGQNLLHFLRQPEFIRYARQRNWPEPILHKFIQEGQDKRLVMQLVKYAGHQRLLITRDMTQVDRLETTRKDFVANVSHELRTPLTVLAGFLETLKDAPREALSAQQQAQYIELMHDQAQRMQAIVGELLTLSDLESSEVAARDDLPMAAIFETAQQQALALSKGRHQFEWDIDASLNIQGSLTEMASAVSNLISNAIRYTPEQGKISVFWGFNAAGQPVFSVTDTGIGIAPEHLPRLSERFYRVDRGRSRALGGTGLGLAITKHIALRHSAKLLITSEINRGSCFSLVFDTSRIS